MWRRRWVPLALVTILATACGVLPGTSSGGGGGDDALPGATTGPRPTATPIPSPTPRPTSTPRPTATPLPTPSPTPAVTDSYTDVLAAMRSLFATETIEADLAEIVPLPFPIPIPVDAELERIEVAYERADFWEGITGQFPAVDTAAWVSVTIGFLTQLDVDTLRATYEVEPLAGGYIVELDQFEAGSFSNVRYELNGGPLQRGRDGETEISIIRQADSTFVDIQVQAELNSDPVPALTEWPTLFAVPFPGGYTKFSALAIEGARGIEVAATGEWTLGSRGSSQIATLETLVEEYPVNGLAVTQSVSTGDDSQAVATITHVTGSTGTISITFDRDHTNIVVALASLAG